MAREKLGDYDIISEVGRGGMGAVYEASSLKTGRVAIKTMLMPPDLDNRTRWEMIERFMTEARAIRALEHRNIVSVLDVGEDEGEFFMVMEFLEGQDLSQLIDMMGAFAPDRAKAIIADVCDALAYSHGREVIHRDIKPDNIFLIKGGVTKLTDFGLARIGEVGSHTQDGTMMGTFAYMSPEQARGERLDPRTDVWSLGVTLYEMLAGKKPFAGEQSAAILQAILTQDAEPIPNLDADLQAVLTKCLARDVNERYQTALEFKEALVGPEEGTVVGRAAVTEAPAAGQVTTPAASGQPGATVPAASPKAPQTTIRQGQDDELPEGWFDTPLDSDLGAPSSAPPRRVGAPKRKGAPRAVTCKCGEALKPNDATCWKCGTPNPRMVAQTKQQQTQAAFDEVKSLAQSMAPKKKKSFFDRFKRG